MITPNSLSFEADTVASDSDTQSATVALANALLTDGLKSCRNLVANYRALLSPQVANDNSLSLDGDSSALEDSNTRR